MIYVAKLRLNLQSKSALVRLAISELALPLIGISVICLNKLSKYIDMDSLTTEYIKL